MKLTIEIADEDAKLIQELLAGTKDGAFCSHGPLDLKKLAVMLLEDVALSVRRPSSWEGANLQQVLQAHGYGYLFDGGQ